jgi:alpha-1,3-mannosyltransferase
LTNPLHCYPGVALLLCIFEIILNVVIVWKVPYTEIDWKAYMEEVEGPLLHNEYNYTNLRGGTGPLVYPAGFVWFFGALHSITENGTNISSAQTIFILLYISTFAVVAAIYQKAAPQSFHPILLAWLCLSKRIHSIFCLRLFNDGPTMLLLYISVLLLLHRKWTLGSIFYSLAFSMKMNILLFGPALGVLLLAEIGLWQSILHFLLFVSIQVFLVSAQSIDLLLRTIWLLS